ncbi:hypothetical protein GF342_03810 [Candidatus Woesearchaeota archaeon]|nr:hypothetical protein [Candidatus Woesearchaeota archaeon]
MYQRKVTSVQHVRSVAITSLCYVATIALLSLLLVEHIALVFLGMLPFLLHLFINFIPFPKKTSLRMWASAPLGALALYAVWAAGILPTINNMDGPAVTVLNLLFSYAANGLALFALRMPARVKVKTRKEIIEVPKIETKYVRLPSNDQQYQKEIARLRTQLAQQETVETSLRSIEDKCKSINFVIGRVYSDKNGGSKELRNTLRIDRELYNTFSALTQNLAAEEVPKLRRVLGRLHTALHRLKRPESELITGGRQDSVITILTQDKDPVQDYFTEATEITSRLLKQFRHR